jgi:hypothetical protein
VPDPLIAEVTSTAGEYVCPVSAPVLPSKVCMAGRLCQVTVFSSHTSPAEYKLAPSVLDEIE